MKISDLLEMMGCKKIKEKGFETMASCPFAPWLHSGGTDRHPSFSVNMILNDGKGVYHCFACGKSGTVRMLIEDYCDISGESQYKYKKFLDSLESEYTIDIAKLNKNNKKEELVIPKEEIEHYYDCLDKMRYHEFFIKENIKPDTIQRWEIAIDNNKIIFPVKNRRGDIEFFVYRWLIENMPKYTVSNNAKTKSAIFGADMLNVIDEEPIVITEGIIDTIYIEQLGFNSVAIFGVFMDNKQVDLIRSYSSFDIISVVFDDDDAGNKGILDAKRKLSKYFYRVNTLNVPAVRMLDRETLLKLTEKGERDVREYF